MKTAVITGAGSGIGLELTKQLKEKGYKVIGVCRTISPELKELGIQVLDQVDVRDPVAIEGLAARLAGESIDLLINNAGAFEKETIDDLDFDSINRQWEINTLGPLRVTNALLPKLSKGSTIAMVSSRMGSVADNTSGGYYGYRMSKAALNMASMSLSRDLVNRGIAVIVLHPGYVKTKLTGYNGDLTPEVSARGLITQIESIDRDQPARFMHTSGEELLW
jgi:NAD(P)-dependent dehydrogenase (short-subunit alcohol dehydrogenase family)